MARRSGNESLLLDASTGIEPWAPENELEQQNWDVVRLSRGFLRLQAKRWFESLQSYWVPLIYTLGAEFRFIRAETSLIPPVELPHNWKIHLGGEPACISMDQSTFELIGQTVLPGKTNLVTTTAVEYLVRRLVATCNKSWTGPAGFAMSLMEGNGQDQATFAGYVKISFELSRQSGTLWFGLTAPIVERLDIVWRKQWVEQHEVNVSLANRDGNMDIELVELAVAPSVLIDYLRTGSIIRLDLPVSSDVIVRADGAAWLSGKLYQSNGTFVLEILDTKIHDEEITSDLTRVQVHLGRFSLNREEMVEYSQIGALMQTGVLVSPQVSLMIGGERVARGTLGKVDNAFVVTVQSR